MHKLPIDSAGQNGSRGLVLRGLLLVSLTLDARTALAQLQITKNGTAVVLQDYARVPLSSRTFSNYPPPIDFSNQLGRANRLRSEPPNAPNSSSRFFVNDHNRNLYILDKTNKTFTPYINFEEVFPNFVNINWAEGLGTFIFDPDYGANGKFYTIHVENPSKTASAAPTNAQLPGLDLTGYTTTPAINPPVGTVIRHSILVEWTDTNINNLTLEGTAREILRVGFAVAAHLIGDLLFNPSAYPGYNDYRNLYISVGDDAAGERFGATHTIPQRLDALGGKILRITPDITLRPGDELGANGRYRIPTSSSNPNPFVSLTLSGLKKEIYAYGFRNPHGMSWDPVSDKLIVDDIGLDTWEEVDIVTKGSNYGYAEREGIEQLLVTNNSNNGKTGSQTNPPTPFPNPDSLTVEGIPTPVTPVYPAAAYGHQDGDAISSGFVYRGSLMPQLTGKYVFGDITTGRLFYADLAELMANDDGVRTTLAGIHELQVVFDSPYDNPDQGLVNRRLFDIVADEYAHRGGSVPPNVLPPYANATIGNDPDGVPYGGGRADIRLALGGDGEIYVLSKSDGMVRLLAGQPRRERDFDGDGKSDILWRHNTGTVAEWLLNGTTIIDHGSPGGATTDWTIVGVGDFNGDGKSDILWRHSTGDVHEWLMNGSTIIGQGSPGGAPTDWTIAGVGDFNGDGKSDILWRHNTGTVAEWLLNGTTIIDHGSPGGATTDWTIVGVGDFNGDDKSDILWRHNTGTVAEWLLNGTTIIDHGSPGGATTDWTIVGVGDFNGDGKSDILWRHSTGDVHEWLLNGSTIIGQGSPGSATTDWTIAGVGDFNGDGKSDILWRHTSGAVYEWLINGSTIVGHGSPGWTTTDWQIQ